MYRALRRHYNKKKALRKKKISRAVYGIDYYDNLHQYSDNKIHCSCGICRFKSPLESDHKSTQDLRIIAAMDFKEKEYKTA